MNLPWPSSTLANRREDSITSCVRQTPFVNSCTISIQSKYCSCFNSSTSFWMIGRDQNFRESSVNVISHFTICIKCELMVLVFHVKLLKLRELGKVGIHEVICTWFCEMLRMVFVREFTTSTTEITKWLIWRSIFSRNFC